jgi:hypothetical protein
LMDMPLTDMLYYFDGSLDTSPEDIVDGLVAAVRKVSN